MAATKAERDGALAAQDGVAAAQRGVEMVAARAAGAGSTTSGGARASGGRRGADGAAPLHGPFLAPGSLTADERLTLIDGIATVLEGIYTHLPLKRARYGVDPIQRLRILRTQVDQLDDDTFHVELADVVTSLRDAHTRYTGPAELAHRVAVLPFLVEMFGTVEAPTYVVTKVAPGLDATFAPGSTIEHWSGVPIDRAVQRHATQEVGGRPDSQRAWAVQSLTFRSLQYGPPPDEDWVIVGYRPPGKGGRRRAAAEIRIPWRIVDTSTLAPDADARDLPLEGGGDAALALAVDPAAEAVRRAKVLLFAPAVLTGGQAAAPDGRRRPAAGRSRTSRTPTMTVIPTQLPGTLKALHVDAPGGPFGYLRIYAFDTRPDPFVAELVRLAGELPERGLILDVRANPGGYIWAAETALQLFTPNPVQPTRFSALATPLTRALAHGPLARDLAPWAPSLDDAVRNGELYAQPVPLTTVEAANDRGQCYGGPVVLVADATTYSSGDLFSAGFVDNALGPFLCVGEATGAGGANVWDYESLRAALAGTPQALPVLPDGIGLSFAYRRATRSGPAEGRPIEDVGVGGTPHGLTLDDLLHDNVDLIDHCLEVLRDQPFSKLAATLDVSTLKVVAAGLDRVDVLYDGHPGTTHEVAGGAAGGADAVFELAVPDGASVITVAGFAGEVLRQRRRLAR